MALGNDRDLRNRLQHVLRLLQPLAQLKAPPDLSPIHLDTSLASAELDSVRFFTRGRTP